MKVVDITKEDFDSFSKNHKYRNYFQTSSYGNVMSNFNYEVRYIGINDDNEDLIGASLLLIQDGAMKTKIAYAPRGMLFDFTDSKLVEELVEALKESLGKEGIVTLKIDPSIPLTIRDKNGNIMNVNSEGKIIVKNLVSSGFTHRGETLYFETEKPRWEAITVLEKDIRDIYQNFDKKTRIKINKAIRNCIKIERDTKKDISTLYSYIKNNGYPLKYYKSICKYFDNVDVFYARVDTEEFLQTVKQDYEKELAINEELTSKFQDFSQQADDRRELFNKKAASDNNLNLYKNNLIFATNLLKDNPDGLIIAGALSLVYDNAAYLITEGVDKKFKGLNANYLLKWQMINEYNSERLKYFNLNAITGDFSDKNKYKILNEIKCSYNAVVTEYIGEFDVILNPFKYSLYQKFTK